MAKLLLFSLPWLFSFLSEFSLIKYIIWNLGKAWEVKVFSRQEAGRGHGRDLTWEGPIRPCSRLHFQCSLSKTEITLSKSECSLPNHPVFPIILVYSILFLLHECDILKVLLCFLNHLFFFFFLSVCFGLSFTVKAFLKCLMIFVYPFLLKVAIPKHGLEALCRWWTCLCWTSLVRKFNGHWFITRYVQIFYPWIVQFLWGRDSLLSCQHCVSLVSWQVFWNSAGKVHTFIIQWAFIHPLVLI